MNLGDLTAVFKTGATGAAVCCQTRTVDRLLRAITATSQYLTPLVWLALTYTGRCLLDLGAVARMGYLWNVRRRDPQKAGEVDARIASLRKSHAARWTAWRALPAGRRIEVRAAVVALAAFVFVLGRWRLQESEPGKTTTQVAVRKEPVVVATRTAGSGSTGNSARRTQTNDADAIALRRAIVTAKPRTWVMSRDMPAALAPEALGAWDDFDVGSPVVLDAGPSILGDTRYRLWYRGCRFEAHDNACGVGYATSKDGVAWTRAPQPVFVPPDPIDRERLTAIALARGKDGYVLWYSVGFAWLSGREVSTLHAATSPDGLRWTAAAEPVYTGVARGSYIRPAAVWDGARFHVWLVVSLSPFDEQEQLFPEMPGGGDYAIIHLTSSDGLHLTPVGSTQIDPLRMDNVAFWVSAPDKGGGFRALFFERSPSIGESQGIAVLHSTDGTSWKRDPHDTMGLDLYELGTHAYPDSLAAVSDTDGFFVWFALPREHGGNLIRVAFRKEGS